MATNTNRYERYENLAYKHFCTNEFLSEKEFEEMIALEEWIANGGIEEQKGVNNG